VGEYLTQLHAYDEKFHKYIKMDPDEVMKDAQGEIEVSPFGKEAIEAMASIIFI
jgi:hypothetical protein